MPRCSVIWSLISIAFRHFLAMTCLESVCTDFRLCVFSSFHSERDEDCVLLGYYAASRSISLPTFRHNLSVPSSGPLKMGPTGCPETSVRNNHYWLRNSPEERRSQLLDHLGRFSLLRTSVRLKGGEGCLMSSTVYRPGEVKVR